MKRGFDSQSFDELLRVVHLEQFVESPELHLELEVFAHLGVNEWWVATLVSEAVEY